MSSDLRWGLGFIGYSAGLAIFTTTADPSVAAFALPAAGVGALTGAYLIVKTIDQRHQEERDERSRRRGRRH